MRVFVRAATAFALAIVVATGAAGQTEPAEPAPEGVLAGAPIVIGESFFIPSEAFGGERRISVRLPAEYHQDPEAAFPVVYVLDGGAEQDFPHIAGIAQSREMNLSFAPFILIGVETENRRAELTPPAIDPAPYREWLNAEPGGSENFRRFLRDDVMTWVEAHYRTNGHDAVIGESLAGLFIVEALFEEPTLFDDYIAVSPSLWWEEMQLAREAADRLADFPDGERRLYLTMADEGDFMQQGLQTLVAALEEHAPEGLSWVYVDRGDYETHATIYHGAALDAFRLFFPEPVRIYRAFPLLDGQPATPRTPEHEARLAEDCTRESAQRSTPEETRADQGQYAYLCFLYDYGARATAGNIEW